MAYRHMNAEIGTEAAHFPEKEYINGIFLAVFTAALLKRASRALKSVSYQLLINLAVAPAWGKKGHLSKLKSAPLSVPF
jgi:hypothetical protein